MDKYFTLHEAQDTLPQIRPVLQQLQELYGEWVGKALRLRRLQEQSLGDAAEREAEVFQLEAGIDFLVLQGHPLLEFLAETGVQLKDIRHGLVDFPAFMDGEEVLLCWHLGEERITHWHYPWEGFPGRKSIPDSYHEADEDFNG